MYGIFTYIWLICILNVGNIYIYVPYMDPMGLFLGTVSFWGPVILPNLKEAVWMP